MNKFVETIDDDGDLVIINLEAITHVVNVRGQLQIHFKQGSTIAKLDGHRAEAFWELLSEKSHQIALLQSTEDKK